MGYFKGFRSRRRRRGFKPFRRATRKRAIIPRTLQPRTKVVKMKAVEYINHTHTSGALSATSIQFNSFDDIWGGASTQQPLGYDQYKALYKKAVVLSSKVVCQIHNNTSTAVMIGLTALPPNQTTGLDSYEYYMEAPNTKSKLLSPDVDRATLSSQMSTKKLWSIKNIKDNKTELEIDLVNETPPTNSGKWQIWSQPQDQTTTTTGTAVQWTCTVSYIVLLYDPIIPARSTDT